MIYKSNTILGLTLDNKPIYKAFKVRNMGSSFMVDVGRIDSLGYMTIEPLVWEGITTFTLEQMLDIYKTIIRNCTRY